MTAAASTFTALPVQDELWSTICDGRYRLIGFGGGIRGTKTWGALISLVLLCRLFPRSRWAIVRKGLPDIRRNVLPSFNKLRDRLGSFVGEVNQSEWTATCANGSQIIFFPESLDVDPELDRWKGLEVNGFLLEEANELAEKSFHKAIERAGAWIVPEGLKQPPPYVICTFNPCANWPKQVFYDPWKTGTIESPYAFIPATAADNPFVPEAQREAWKALPEQEYKRFVEGDWDVLTGRFFDNANPAVHLRPRADLLPEEIPEWWEAWGGYDWGYAHWATFGLYVRRKDGVVVCVDTLWLRKLQDPDQAVSVRRFAQDHGLARALETVYAGRDAFNKVTAHGASGLSTADVFAAHHITLVRADDDRVNGARAVRRALQVNDGMPGVALVKTPGNTRVFQQITEAMPDPNDINKVLKVDADSEGRGGDDGLDQFRNALSTFLPASQEPSDRQFADDYQHGHDAAPLIPHVHLDPDRPGWSLPPGF